jgi:peptide/nickel transport system substrate-binding protein
MQRNQLIAVVVVIVIVGAAGAFFLLQPAPPTNQSIVWETIGNPQYLDPATDYETFGSWICYNVYETLYTYPWDTADTTPSVPLLAQSLSISSDGLNYTFTLRQGIKFSDGTPFNASCVKYNFERVLALFDSFGPAWMLAEPILGGQAVEDAVYTYGEGSTQHVGNYTAWKAANDAGTGAIIVLDDYTVRIRLAAPYTPFLAAITYEVGAMISPTWCEAHGGITIGEHNTYVDNHMCGTGPYMLDTWVPDERIDLTLNPNYWRAAASKADHPNSGAVSTVSIKTNEEVNSRILDIQAGESDGTYWPTDHAYEVWNNVTGSSGDGTLKSSNPNLKVWCGEPTYDVMFLGFNMNPTYNLSGSLVQSPFTLKDTRQAFAYAFDYETFINNVVNGFGEQLKGPIPDGMFGYKSDLFTYSYDLSKAQQSWNLAMTEGLDDALTNASGQLTIYYNSGNTVREAACLLLKDGIDALLAMDGTTQPAGGLTINVQPLEWANYLYQVQHRQLPIFFLGWAPDFADPDDYVGPFVKSTGTYPLRIGLGQSTGWNATYYDGLIAQAAQSQDSATRQSLYYTLQTAIVNQVAYIWCYQATNFHVEYKTMNGYVYNPMHDPYFYHYWKST